MEDRGENDTLSDSAWGLVLQLVQANPGTDHTLTSIYRHQLARPASEGLEELLIRIEQRLEVPSQPR